uniref:Uncharacterized protein n=1 Tax=Cacopsylla melanoneura TaxID=428564 RepID=A0A8D9BGA3_9HEMI
MASKVFAFEDKLKLYSEEIQNSVLIHFPTVVRAKEDDINISPQIYGIMTKYLSSLTEEFKRRFQELRNKHLITAFYSNWCQICIVGIPAVHLYTDTVYSSVLLAYIGYRTDSRIQIQTGVLEKEA